MKNTQKKSALPFLPIFFIFSKNPKISNLSRDKAPEFQNYVIEDMKTSLDGCKKVKTQLFRRRGRRKIQKESYLTSKNCRVKMTHPLRRSRVNIWGVKMPPRGVTTTFWGQNNIKNEISTIKLLNWQIFSKIRQLLKNHYLRGDFLTFLGSKMPPRGRTRIFPAYAL